MPTEKTVQHWVIKRQMAEPKNFIPHFGKSISSKCNNIKKIVVIMIEDVTALIQILKSGIATSKKVQYATFFHEICQPACP